MRFGIPADFQLLVEVSTPTGVLHLQAQENSLTIHNDSIEPFSIAKTLESASSSEASDFVQIHKDTALKFDYQRKQESNYLHDHISHKLQQLKLDVENLQSKLHHNSVNEKAAIDAFNTDVQQSIQSQNVLVQKLINDEKERIRRIEEMKRQKEEEQRRRLEEEKRRREEEARRKREDDERKRKEQEAKLAEERRLKQERDEREKQHKLELEKQRREKERLEAEAKKEAEQRKAAQQNSLTDFAAIEQSFLQYKKNIVDIKETIVGPMNEDKDLKKLVNSLKRKINPKFGQLSNSYQQLNRIKHEVVELVSQAKGNELAYKWILNFVAKAIVDQAETEVIVKPNAALPLAHLAYTLLETFTEFDYYLSSRFVKKCPYIIGYTCSIDSEEGRTRMGWKRRDNKWEDDTKYDERVSGICMVWATMSRLLDYPQQLSFYSFEASWKFLARLLNRDLSLLTNAHFSILGNWWEAAAKEFSGKYGVQASKLLNVLTVDLPVAVSDRKYPAAARLLILGEDLQNNRNWNSLKEMER